MSDQMKNITIADVADSLGISKTTVSRAISGKGRISESTRQKVLSFIEEHNYKPNVIAKGLAQSRTYNICVVMPESFSLVDMPFFKDTITGIQEVAELAEYDILLCISQKNNLSNLDRIISNGKVDGVILLRTFTTDPQIELLQEKGIPFVTTGSSDYKGVKQVDFNHEAASFEMTALLLDKGLRRIALLGGDRQIMANQNRYAGFARAFRERGLAVMERLVYTGLHSSGQVHQAVGSALAAGADCLLCMDDAICSMALQKLHDLGIEIPEDVKIASFHSSSMLQYNNVSITTLHFDSKEMGMTACRSLFDLIEGMEIEDRQLLPYELLLRRSTK